MASTKLSALPELAAPPADNDQVYIRDVSEPAADESKRITINNLHGGLDLSADEVFAILAGRGRTLYIPTNAGWTETVTGTGSTSQFAVSLETFSGTTASSTGMLTAVLRCGLATLSAYRINWDKKLYIKFVGKVDYNNATSIKRFQIKQAATIGALAGKGLGIRVDNLALKGESYGSNGSVATVDLSTTLLAADEYLFEIILDPGVSIKWYVDGVLKGTQSTAGDIPAGQGTANGYIVASVINGGNTANSAIFVGSLSIWRET